MMRAVLEMEDWGARCELLGHAGDERICAAISTLCCAVLNALGTRAREAVYEPGEVRFSVRRPSSAQRACLTMFALGLRALAENFPDDADVTLIGDWAL